MITPEMWKKIDARDFTSTSYPQQHGYREKPRHLLKITPEIFAEMKAKRASGVTVMQLSKDYAVSMDAIRKQFIKDERKQFIKDAECNQ